MSKNFVIGFSAFVMIVGLYCYRPDLSATVLRRARTAISNKTSTAPELLTLPDYLSSTGPLTKADLENLRNSFLPQLSRNIGNYKDCVYAVVQRLKSDSWYSGFTALAPIPPATTITTAQINTAGASLGDPLFSGRIYSSKPTAKQIQDLKSLFDRIKVNVLASVNPGDHAKLKEALFSHVSELTGTDASRATGPTRSIRITTSGR